MPLTDIVQKFCWAVLNMLFQYVSWLWCVNAILNKDIHDKKNCSDNRVGIKKYHERIQNWNGVSLACQWWPNIDCWMGSFVIFQGTRTSITMKPYHLVIFRGGPCPPLWIRLWVHACINSLEATREMLGSQSFQGVSSCSTLSLVEQPHSPVRVWSR